MLNDSSVEGKLSYAAELHQRSSRISSDGNYISEPLLNCDALGQAEGLPLNGIGAPTRILFSLGLSQAAIFSPTAATNSSRAAATDW
jgi:hypothetical protein